MCNMFTKKRLNNHITVQLIIIVRKYNLLILRKHSTYDPESSKDEQITEGDLEQHFHMDFGLYEEVGSE